MNKEDRRWLYTLSFCVIMLMVLIIPPLVYKPKTKVVPKKTEKSISIEETLRKSAIYRDSLLNDAEVKLLEIMNTLNQK